MVQGHHNAYNLQILHRNVSPPNIMMKVRCIDEEFAVPGMLYLCSNGALTNFNQIKGYYVMASWLIGVLLLTYARVLHNSMNSTSIVIQ